MLVLVQHFLAEDGFRLKAEYIGIVAQNVETEHRHQARYVPDSRERRRLSGPLLTVVLVTCLNCQYVPLFRHQRLLIVLHS